MTEEQRLEVISRLKRGEELSPEWKKNPNETISEETIADIHTLVGRKVGRKFYIIAPMMAFDFFQDYIDVGTVRYYALRIPYTMIQELHSRDFKSVLQAREEGNVNDIQEAYGFSFMVAPEVGWKARVETQKEDLFTHAVLETKTFVSKVRIKGTEREGGMETLATLMVDLQYDGKVFDLDKALYGEELEHAKWTVRFDPDDVGGRVLRVTCFPPVVRPAEPMLVSPVMPIPNWSIVMPVVALLPNRKR